MKHNDLFVEALPPKQIPQAAQDIKNRRVARATNATPPTQPAGANTFGQMANTLTGNPPAAPATTPATQRSEEHTSELQSH